MSLLEINKESSDLLSWFIKNKRRIAWSQSADDINVTPDGLFKIAHEVRSNKDKAKKI